MKLIGTRERKLKSETPRDLVCICCGNSGTTKINIMGKYAHILFIPFFPLWKTGNSECGHCNDCKEKGGMTDDYKAKYKEIKKGISSPIWFWLGSFLLLCLGGYLSWVIGFSKGDEIDYIHNPQAEDVYKFKTPEGNFSLMKVKKVSVDSVFVVINDFESTKMQGLGKLEKDENYGEEILGIPMDELLDQYEDGIIYDVDRD